MPKVDKDRIKKENYKPIKNLETFNVSVVIYYILRFKDKISMIPLIDVKNVLVKFNTHS